MIDCEKLFHGLSISEKEVLSFQLDAQNQLGNANDTRLDLLINYDAGKIVGITNLNPYSENFLVLKEFGTIQIWNSKKRSIVNRVQLNKEVIFYFNN